MCIRDRDGEGNMTATVENNHMVINMMGEYHANVLTVEGAEYLSYKTEQSSTTFGNPAAITNIEVPEKDVYKRQIWKQRMIAWKRQKR